VKPAKLFKSKEELHRRLLERHFAELRSIWRDHLFGDDPPEERVSRAVDAWFAYVQAHPFAWRMLFRDTTGDTRLEAIRREVAAESRALLLPVLAHEASVENVAGAAGEAQEMLWVAISGVIQGLALWWYDHQHVPREPVVATAMNALWVGFERVRRGQTWAPGAERSVVRSS